MIARLLGVLLLGVSLVTHATASPITGGSATLNRNTVGDLDIFGPGVALDAHYGDAVNLVCQICSPFPQSLALILSVGDFNLGGGELVWDGITYTVPFLFGQLAFEGTWTPPEPGPPIVAVTAPFTFSGFLTPSLTSDTLDLTGHGTATIHLALDSGFYFRESVVYDFATPEPTTVLLVGSGLAAWLGVRQYRRRLQ